jgi:hypothetical protein
MGRTWVLDTETKGTGASMVPLETTLEKKPERPPRRSRPSKPPRRKVAPRPTDTGRTTVTPLPEGHVRKKATGEIGKIRSVDARAGTANVHWLKRGSASTVPLSALSRR